MIKKKFNEKSEEKFFKEKINEKNKTINFLLIFFALLLGIFIIFFLFSWIFNPVMVGPQELDGIEEIFKVIEKIYPNGQEVTNYNFVLRKGSSFNLTDLSLKTGFSENSFVFIKNEELNGLFIGDFGLFYDGPNKKIFLSALVVCKPSEEELKKELNELSEMELDTNSVNCGEDLPCCAIIPMKRR